MNEEPKSILRALIYPAIFIALMWLVKLIEITFKIDLAGYGLQPLTIHGLLGVLTSPFLHADFSHLFANSIPLFLLAGMLFYFYKPLAWRILFLTYLLTGFWVWCFARGNAVHIGASGVVYGLTAFLFLSGIIRRDVKLMAITLLTTFLYGSMVWGIFPQFFPLKKISWESHLMGLVSGAILAIYYRKLGPQRKQYVWEEEEDDEEDSEDPTKRPYWAIPPDEKSAKDSTTTTGSIQPPSYTSTDTQLPDDDIGSDLSKN